MRRASLAFATLLFVAPAPGHSQVINEPGHCEFTSSDGCTNIATYSSEYNRTSWSVDCPDGFFASGTLSRNECATFCLGVG